MAGRIRVENKVDFSNPRNLITVAVALTAGVGDLTLKFGAFTIGGIGTATFGAIILISNFCVGQGGKIACPRWRADDRRAGQPMAELTKCCRFNSSYSYHPVTNLPHKIRSQPHIARSAVANASPGAFAFATFGRGHRS